MNDGIHFGIPYKLSEHVLSGFCGTIISQTKLKSDRIQSIDITRLLKFPPGEKEERLKQYMRRFKTPA